MRFKIWPLILALVLLVSCGPSGSDQVPVAELPDPAIYALTISELPEVGLAWQQTYNQTSSNEGYKWSYLAYQAYQPGTLGVMLESAYAVNNDVVLYEVDMSHAELPSPPSAMGNIQNITWKSASIGHRIGDKSAVWKTSLGEMLTPVWWLEFHQGHAYVRISLLGFPDQIAPPILYGMADIVVKRLPRSVATLRSDAATLIATPALRAVPTITEPAPALVTQPSSQTTVTSMTAGGLSVLGYTAPPGETGMVSFFDESGNQLADGVIGSDDILADLGNGTAYEWVGWTEQTDPVTLTFTVDGKIGAVQIGFNHREGLGIFVPESVTIAGKDFVLGVDDVANNTRGELTFNGPFVGPEVQIVLHHRARGWILVDEVVFLPAQ